jgi:hypothetical protein
MKLNIKKFNRNNFPCDFGGNPSPFSCGCGGCCALSACLDAEREAEREEQENKNEVTK